MLRVLDLFCGEGGAAMGYHLAGFEVIGVDVVPQPRYPFQFLQANAVYLDPAFVAMFDLVHASPPCQFGTALRHAPNAKGEAGHPNLIPATRELLRAAGAPYVIENVEAVRGHLIEPVLLCGTMFDLAASTAAEERFRLQRHRLFETDWGFSTDRTCDHAGPVIGVYGGHVRNRSFTHGGRGTVDFAGEDRPAMARQAMGMDWATMGGMSEAVPPAFTWYIGGAFRERQWALGALGQAA